MSKTDSINKLIQDNKYQRYLEIGVAKPEYGYLMVNCAEKECVDPCISDEYEQFSTPPECLTYCMTSDEMFAQMPEDKNYDIIFIDGLHLEEQVDKDIFNSLKHLSENGCIVVHDCLPKEEICQEEQRSVIDWNGSVWKSITKLGVYGLKYITVDADYGVCIIKAGQMPELPSICRLKWNDFEEKRDLLLHVVSEEYFWNTPSDILWDNFYNNFYEIRLHNELFSRLYHKDESDKDKYMVITCVRNENDYIKEWIEHYLKLGFDKIIICDNNDDDVLNDLLRNYIASGTVEIFDFRGCPSFQVQMYTTFARYGNYKWCAYFDCDEFLELECYTNIKEFLDTIEDDCISFNWIVYGSNGKKHKDIGRVQDRFTKPVSPICMFKENMFVKSILRGGEDNKFRNCWFNGSHIPMYGEENAKYTVGGFLSSKSYSHQYFPPRYKLGYIKHYYTKSFDEWIKKANRGWPDGTTNLAAANFFLCEGNNEISIENYTEGLFLDAFSGDVNLKYNILDKFDVIQITNENSHPYAFLGYFARCCKIDSGHTYIFTDNDIDETLFNICLEISFATGNNLVFARNQDEVWRAFLKYNKGKSNTYYILKVQ